MQSIDFSINRPRHSIKQLVRKQLRGNDTPKLVNCLIKPIRKW
jgi:hypothetical protein